MMVKNKKSNKKVIVVTVLAVFVGAVSYFYLTQNDEPAARTENPIQDSAENEVIDLEPATEADKQENDDKKDEIVSEQEEENNASSDKKSVTPTITSAALSGSKVDVRGYVSKVVEDGGTCEFTFTGKTTFTVTSKGVSNVSTTNCGVSVPKSKFSGGNWKVTFSYSSEKAEGKSDALLIEGL